MHVRDLDLIARQKERQDVVLPNTVAVEGRRGSESQSCVLDDIASLPRDRGHEEREREESARTMVRGELFLSVDSRSNS